jgi:hypothetical protein
MKVLTSRVSNDLKQMMTDPKEITHSLNISTKAKRKYDRYKRGDLDTFVDKNGNNIEEIKFNADSTNSYMRHSHNQPYSNKVSPLRKHEQISMKNKFLKITSINHLKQAKENFINSKIEDSEMFDINDTLGNNQKITENRGANTSADGRNRRNIAQ